MNKSFFKRYVGKSFLIMHFWDMDVASTFYLDTKKKAFNVWRYHAGFHLSKSKAQLSFPLKVKLALHYATLNALLGFANIGLGRSTWI